MNVILENRLIKSKLLSYISIEDIFNLSIVSKTIRNYVWNYDTFKLLFAEIGVSNDTKLPVYFLIYSFRIV